MRLAKSRSKSKCKNMNKNNMNKKSISTNNLKLLSNNVVYDNL